MRVAQTRQEHQSKTLIDSFLHVSTSLCNATMGIFYWIGPDGEMLDPQTLNVPDHMLNYYATHMIEHDPLNIRNLLKCGAKIVSFKCRRTYPQSSTLTAAYAKYFENSGLEDEIELVLMHDGDPIGCLGLIRPTGAPPFSLDTFNWEALRTHFQTAIRSHWRLQQINVNTEMSREYRLNPREREVVATLALGKSNAQIAEILDVRVSTVKSHILNIMNKMGVDSRVAIANVFNDMQY